MQDAKDSIAPWIKELAPEQLPEPYQSLAIMSSSAVALEFAWTFQGNAIYFPKLDALLKKDRNRRICAEFNGSNHKELAFKYGITERWVYTIVATDSKKQLATPTKQ